MESDSDKENELIRSMASSYEDDEVIETNAMKKSKQFELVKRPSLGQSGRNISLLTNHFHVVCSNTQVYQYNLRISPELFSKKLNRIVFQRIQQSIDGMDKAFCVFDGWHTVYSTKQLDVEAVLNAKVLLDGVIHTADKNATFGIWICLVDRFRLDTECPSDAKLQVMSALDTILRQISCETYQVILQSFYETQPNIDRGIRLGHGKLNLGLGREVCYGYYQNIVETFDIVTLNVDVATTTFYRPINMVDFLAEVLDLPVEMLYDRRTLSDNQKKKFSKEICGLKVETTHCDTIRRYRVLKCTWKPASSIVLSILTGPEEEHDVPLIDYYKNRYNIDLNFHHLPCLEVSRSRECIIPLELCTVVPGQRCIRKLSEQQIASLIKATSRNAKERKDAVMGIRHQVGVGDDRFSRGYGLTVDNRMMRLEGRVLPPPRLLYSSPISKQQDCIAVPNNGTWDMRGKNFYSGIQIQSWAVVCFASTSMVCEQNLRQFVNNLMKVAGEIGMPFVDEPSFCKYAGAEHISKILEYLQTTTPSLQLIICVVPGKSSIYADLKRKGDMIGLTTQCIRSHNVLKSSAHTMSNLCMKINSKLGGVNMIISNTAEIVAKQPVLFVGCHLSRNTISTETSTIDTSICCLVGSMDGHPTRFTPTFRTQPRHLCVISEIGEMMKEIIVNFFTATSFKPHRIIVYRSGISDSNVQEIMQYELRGIREACVSIDQAYQPGITLIGLDITHHTRLFAANDSDRMGSSLNVPAGTIVETGVTLNNLFEFYLVSHAGIQGTSRPTKYIVMWDDNKIEPEELHELTYQLCHTQSRCTRSVAIPSPVYYAKLVAQRAKILMTEEGFNVDNYRDIMRQCDGMLFT